MTWQEGAIIVILVVAVIYAGRQIYRTLTNKEDACKGCALAEKCTKKKGCPVCGGECQERKLAQQKRHNC